LPREVTMPIAGTEPVPGAGGSVAAAQVRRHAAEADAVPRREPAAGTRAAPPREPIRLPEFAQYRLQFRRDEGSGRVVVQVVDAETGALVRSIPPEEIVRALRQLRETQGPLVDREA
jgi:flagellar protein FlaG